MGNHTRTHKAYNTIWWGELLYANQSKWKTVTICNAKRLHSCLWLSKQMQATFNACLHIPEQDLKTTECLGKQECVLCKSGQGNAGVKNACLSNCWQSAKSPTTVAFLSSRNPNVSIRIWCNKTVQQFIRTSLKLSITLLSTAREDLHLNMGDLKKID